MLCLNVELRFCRLRRTKLTMLPCCTSDLKRRNEICDPHWSRAIDEWCGCVEPSRGHDVARLCRPSGGGEQRVRHRGRRLCVPSVAASLSLAPALLVDRAQLLLLLPRLVPCLL